MSGPSWYIIGASVIILQQIAPIVLQEDACRKREKFFSQFTVPGEDHNKSLSSFSVQCTAHPTVFEVWFKNKQLCICGRITRANTPTFLNCLKRFPLDFTVVISVEKVSSRWGDNCTFRFNFVDGVTTTLDLGISPGKVVTSSFVNPQPSESSITLYTGNTVSPTRNLPILQTVVSSIQQSPVPSLQHGRATKSVLMMSLVKDRVVSKASSFIQASPTSEVLPSSTMSSKEKDKGKFDGCDLLRSCERIV
ncbi:Hypothetical predicted protein [Paramuricea clavata]|uniref:Uncharacterized protein n=1 Tax=Paramuricea clavata TaxID=317549 RepID=A0A7D9DWL8_PARCT|nr:Hypothetical predicted protein [Paramuricea clavata]